MRHAVLSAHPHHMKPPFLPSPDLCPLYSDCICDQKHDPNGPRFTLSCDPCQDDPTDDPAAMGFGSPEADPRRRHHQHHQDSGTRSSARWMVATAGSPAIVASPGSRRSSPTPLEGSFQKERPFRMTHSRVLPRKLEKKMNGARVALVILGVAGAIHGRGVTPTVGYPQACSDTHPPMLAAYHS